jgi:tetratricopeptide (TPR) repeat protein
MMTDDRPTTGRPAGVTCTADRANWNRMQTQGLVAASRREHGAAVIHLTAARDRIGRDSECDQARARVQFALGQSLMALNQPRSAIEPFKDALEVEQSRIEAAQRPQGRRSSGSGSDDPDDEPGARPVARAAAPAAAPARPAPGPNPAAAAAAAGGITALLIERFEALAQAQEDANELSDAETTARRWIAAAERFFTGRPVSRAGDAHGILGEVLFKRERYEEAEAALKRALEIQEPQSNVQPGLARTRATYASLLDATGRTDEARALRERAAQASPRR